MSKSRWGGFRKGRKLFANSWDRLRTPGAASQSVAAPTSPTEFNYTNAQGIWNLNSTVNFRGTPGEGGGASLNFTFLAYGSSVDSASITIPVLAQAGDIAVLFDSTATGVAAVPSGWTSIYSDDVTFEKTVSYKILSSGEAGTTITGQTDAQYSVKQMLVFRPSTAINTITISNFVTSGQTDITPSQQTVAASVSGSPTIVFGMIRAYQQEPFINETFWDDSYYLTEGNGNSVKVFYEIQSTNTTRTVTASGDYGSYNHTLGFALNAS